MTESYFVIGVGLVYYLLFKITKTRREKTYQTTLKT